jgi:pimeloyl-ACP methyl ester carboxylesterase
MPPTQDVSVTTGDGRTLEVVVDGPEDGFPFVFQTGTPSAAGSFPPVVEAAAARGLRTISYSRPGYGRSTPQIGRQVSDAPADVDAIVRAFGADRFVTLGWSGGGPHALACAALRPDNCTAAATLAGVAPYDADGLDWMAGMGEENVIEFSAALDGFDSINALLESWAPTFATLTADAVAASFGDLMSEVDKKAVTGDFAEYLAATTRHAVSSGVAGWRDDDLAFATPWGLDLARITVPVSIWQGAQDQMVPYAHGRWLAAHVSGANAHLYEDHGHLSLLAEIDAIFDDLVSWAGLRRP